LLCCLFFQIPICRDNDGGDWQVDVDMIDGLFASLVEYLQLENAYNIFILNPKRAEKKTKYGYRLVFLLNVIIYYYYKLQ